MYLTFPRYCNKCGKKFIYGIEENELHKHKGPMSYLCDDCAIGTSQYVPPIIKDRMLQLTKEQFANLPPINQAHIISKSGQAQKNMLLAMMGRTPENTFQEYPKKANTRVEKYCNNCGKRFIYESEHLWEPDPLYLCKNCK